MKAEPAYRSDDWTARRPSPVDDVEFAFGNLCDWQGVGSWQTACCAMCGTGGMRNKPSGTFRSYLDLDHDHVTGLARGFLCEGCNASEGRTKTDFFTVEDWEQYRAEPPAALVGLRATKPELARVMTRYRKLGGLLHPIVARLRQRGIHIHTLAAVHGLNISHVKNCLTGRAQWEPDELVVLTDALGVPVTELLDDAALSRVFA